MSDETKAGSELSGQLERRICPGCGDENPKSETTEYFCCEKCGWERDGRGMPTLKEIISRGMECDGVNLGAYLKTLLKAI